jgi:hypothetical protein
MEAFKKKRGFKMAEEQSRQLMREDTEAERIGEYWTVIHAEILLPTFDGNPKEVRNFILTTESILDMLHEIRKEHFVKCILAHIVADAKFKLNKRIIDTWEDIKKALEENYNTNRTLDYTAGTLFTARQFRMSQLLNGVIHYSIFLENLVSR